MRGEVGIFCGHDEIVVAALAAGANAAILANANLIPDIWQEIYQLIKRGDLAATNRQRIRVNNYKAMRAAIRKALENQPTLEEILTEKESARHPFRYAP